MGSISMVIQMAAMSVIVFPVLLLTVSFFILFANRKVETQGVKTLGTVICVILWIGSALLFLSGTFSLIQTYPMMQQRQQMMMQQGGRPQGSQQMPRMQQPPQPKQPAQPTQPVPAQQQPAQSTPPAPAK